MSRKEVIIFISIFFIFLVFVAIFALKAGANDKIVCYPFPSETITPTPTETPTSTEIPITITPTKEATPSPTIIQTPSNSSGGSSSTNAPGVCSDTKPSDVANFIVIPDSKGLKLEWALVLGAENIDIRYGLKDDLWLYGALNISNTGNYVVEGLQPNTPYYFQIAGVHGCSVGNWSKTIDPVWNP